VSQERTACGSTLPVCDGTPPTGSRQPGSSSRNLEVNGWSIRYVRSPQITREAGSCQDDGLRLGELLGDIAVWGPTPPLALVLYARLLASAGEVDEAVRQYRRGVKADPGVADREFAERLGIRSADEFEAEFDPETSEVIDGRVRSAWSERAQGSTIEVDRSGFLARRFTGRHKESGWKA
jgi:hypothetical protein